MALRRALLLLPALCAGPAAARLDTSSLVGSAYAPSGASNDLWWPWYAQYAPAIDRELAAAARHLGMSTLRVFLHHKTFEANASGLLASISGFLGQASSHGFGVGLVLFDSCWGTGGANVSAQCQPTPGVHNGCWFEGPEEADKTTLARFQPYVEAVVRAFGSDARVRWIEVYNEPHGNASSFTLQLRDAAYRWALALGPAVPVMSCWDDNNNTQVVDTHQYSVAFASSWAPAVYANEGKGAVITEGGSRWYQPPFGGDYGSPLTVINFLQALRAEAAAGARPFVPGAILNWELMVGNSNTRWHWGSAPGAPEPAIPWDGWLFSDGTPVSYAEAAALRRYTTGADDFLLLEKYLTDPPVVEDGDAYLALPAGAAHAAPSAPLAEAVVEASLWVEEGGAVALVVRGAGLRSSAGAGAERVQRTGSAAAAAGGGKQRTQPDPAPPAPCAFDAVLNNTDACSGGPPGYRDLSVAGAASPLAACAAACCAWDACSAWVVRALAGTDGNCSDTLCCWLKPGCDASQTRPSPGTSAAFRSSAPPGPPLPLPAAGYLLALNTSTDTLEVVRVGGGGGGSAVLGSLDLRTRRNGLVRGAWNLLRVVCQEVGGGARLRLSVFFNPTVQDAGLLGDPERDMAAVPVRIAPVLVVEDAAPLPPGGVGVLAGGREARVDYLAALPLAVL
jgi:hypothetical protein